MSAPEATGGDKGAAPPPSLEAAISALPDLLGRRLAEIEKREEELAKAEKAFAEETGKAYGSAKPGDVLQLNVGGTKLSVLRSTICYAEGSMLASKFSGRWDDSLERDKDGDFFVDQPYGIFCALINYFRACMSATPKAPPVSITNMIRHLSVSDKADFIRMVEYYGCTGAIYPIRIHSNSETAKICQYPDRTVDSPDWSTFIAKPNGHSRWIKSFQVEVGDIERIVVGVSASKEDSIPSTFKGLGEEDCTLGIDSSNSSVVAFNESRGQTDLEGVKIAKGSIIRFDLQRCGNDEGYSSWPEKVFVNGKLVLTWDDILAVNGNLSLYSQVFPAISVKGSFRICDVELGLSKQ